METILSCYSLQTVLSGFYLCVQELLTHKNDSLTQLLTTWNGCKRFSLRLMKEGKLFEKFEVPLMEALYVHSIA